MKVLEIPMSAYIKMFEEYGEKRRLVMEYNNTPIAITFENGNFIGEYLDANDRGTGKKVNIEPLNTWHFREDYVNRND